MKNRNEELKMFQTIYPIAVLRKEPIRIIDGRFSDGFVDEVELKECIKRGLLKTELHSGVKFAVYKG